MKHNHANINHHNSCPKASLESSPALGWSHGSVASGGAASLPASGRGLGLAQSGDAASLPASGRGLGLAQSGDAASLPQPARGFRLKQLAGKLTCRLFTAAMLLAAVLGASLALAAVAKPVSAQSSSQTQTTEQSSGQQDTKSCGAGTYMAWGACIPCHIAPRYCSDPVQTPQTPNTQTQQQQGQQSSQDHRVDVNTISANEAPNYNLGVHNPEQETHQVCTVSGAPAYSVTPAGAASGKCSSRAAKYFDAAAACPAGTHPRPKGDSGRYWCNSDRTDYVLNSQVVGHTVCMRGAIAITATGLCRYCAKVNSAGQALNRSESIARLRCIYGTANPTPTTRAWATTTTTRITTAATTTTAAPVPTYWFPATTWAPPTTRPAPSSTVWTPPPAVATTAAATTTTTAAPQPERPVGLVFPEVELKWAPQQAIVKLPLFVWLEVAEAPATQTWTDSQGRSFTAKLELDQTKWRFEVVNGQGQRWVDSITARRTCQPWRPGWVGGRFGEVTATAFDQGACFYTYNHMGDGSPRELSAEVTWVVRSCPVGAEPADESCASSTHKRTKRSFVTVTELQALVD